MSGRRWDGIALLRGGEGSGDDRVAATSSREGTHQKPYKGLSDKLETVCGRKLPVLALRRIESGARRVDVDDLVALAMVFGVSPVRLLLPPTDPGEAVPLTDKQSESWQAAWRWAVGELPILPAGERIGATDRRVTAHIRDSRPFERQPIQEIGDALNRRITAEQGPGWSATFGHDPETGRVRGRLQWTSGSADDGDADGSR